MASSIKFLMCIILVLLSSATTTGRSLKTIGVAREAFEVQFRRVLANQTNSNDYPDRESPGGPDPHHHTRRLY
ncbi:hypothetical protein CsSME_00030349 [Camellia sinensis var. sinensis]